ncbi:MAG: enoyl-CoA hydratase/isomerase family protein [Bacteroidetes bacterium]|nr:enoyl-CoA hydratase/isomerase family protein [Bacteroidota bacterium]
MIKYFKENGIANLILNRPEKRNALHPQMVDAIIQKLDEIKNLENIKVLILTGEGKSFCAGADLSYLNDLQNNSTIENEIDSEKLAKMFITIYNFPKPTIAAVNGSAIAGGCGLASVCDFIVAHPSESKFGYSEVKIGFIPAIVSIFLIKKVGQGAANKLLLTGDIITGNYAHQIGLVDYVSEDIMSESKNLAEKLMQNSDESMSLTKKMIHSISNMNIEDAVNYCIRLNTISRSTKDFQNGIKKFLNK